MTNQIATPDLTAAFVRFDKEGDKSAIEQVFAAVLPELWSDVRSHRFRGQDAEDLVQETLLTALEHRSRFDPSYDVLPWIRGILRNHVRTFRRRQVRRVDGVALDRELFEDRRPEDLAELDQVRVRLRGEVDKLSPRYRDVIHLYLQGVTSPQEIAARLGRRPSTVRTQLERCLARLRSRSSALSWAWLLAVVAGRDLPGQGDASALRIAGSSSRGLLYAAFIAVVAIPVALTWPGTDGPGGSVSSSGGADVTSGRSVSRSIGNGQEAVGADRVVAASTGSVEVEVDAGTAPVIGGHVVMRRILHDWLDRVSARPRLATILESGTAVFEDVPAGEYLVSVFDTSNLRRISVAAGEVVAVRLRALTSARVTGVVRDALGRRVAGATIWMSGGDRARGKCPVATSGDDGRFEASLCSATPVLWASHAEHASSGYQVVRHWRTAHPLEFRLREPSAGVVGLITDEQQQPVANALVMTTGVGCPATSVHTDRCGRFALPNLSSEDRRLIVIARGYAPATRGLQQGRSAEIEVALQRGARVRGNVDGLGRLPPGVEYRARWRPRGRARSRAELTPWCRLGADTEFELESLPAGEGSIEVFERGAPRAVVAKARVSLAAGQERRIRLVAISLEVSRVQVLDREGRPVPGVQLQLCRVGKRRRPLRLSVCDEEGRAVVRGVPYGKYSVILRDRRAPSVEMPRDRVHVLADAWFPEVVLGAETTLHVGPEFGQVASVRAVMDMGLSALGYRFRVRQRHAGLTRPIEWERNGVVQLDDLPLGEYVLEVGRGNRWHRLEEWQLSSPEDVDLGEILVPDLAAANKR